MHSKIQALLITWFIMQQLTLHCLDIECMLFLASATREGNANSRSYAFQSTDAMKSERQTNVKAMFQLHST